LTLKERETSKEQKQEEEEIRKQQEIQDEARGFVERITDKAAIE
jgi:hypothetical protein